MTDDLRSRPSWHSAPPAAGASAGRLALLVVWSLAEPGRVGETALLPPGGGLALLGRGPAAENDPGARLVFGKWRPTGFVGGGPLVGNGLSRRQLLVREHDGKIELERLGRSKLIVGGRPVDRAELGPGATAALEGQLVLRVTNRNEPVGGAAPAFAFGAPDPFGLIGESPALWALREELQLAARLAGPVLVSGPPGSGKELVARALHAAAQRSGPFIARSAVTLPSGIIEAGDAGDATLFLEELAELPEILPVHLLRLLDAGEYQRVGENHTRRTDVRLVAASVRSDAAFKFDLLARFRVKLSVPGLAARSDDIPLLVRGLLRQRFERQPELAARFADAHGEPLVSPDLVLALLEHRYQSHVRELDELIELALSGSSEGHVAFTPEVAARTAFAMSALPSRERVEAALQRTGGDVSRAWKELGLSSRDTLLRILRKHGITTRRP
jgi:transcriptional regulator with GAF, ATPase, and Fis domain